MISSGATTVTFLLLAGMVPGSRNCLQVIDEIQAIRSPSSVSGFRFSFTMRLPAGNFLQVLKSFSPISWFAPVTPAVAAGRRSAWRPGGVGVAAGAAPERAALPPSTPGRLGIGARRRASPGDGVGVAPGRQRLARVRPRTGFPSGP